MVLNNKPQMFQFFFPSNFFYPYVEERWTPYIEKMKLPYMTVTDFINNQVQSLTFPSTSIESSMQQREQYDVAYTSGKELEQLISKNINVTFKLTESYISYFIFWDQIDYYLHYKDGKEKYVSPWMEPFQLTFMTDAGFGSITYIFNEISPTNISDINLSYAASVASYNTFSVSFRYNNFIIK